MKRPGLIATMAALLALASGGAAAYAQEGGVTVRVTYVAGQNVYLDAGRDQRILPGDTLAVYRDGALAGRLVVVSSISDRSVATFADTPFPMTRGMELQVRAPVPPGEETPAPPPDAEPDPAVVPPAEQAADPYAASRTTPQRRARTGPRVDGRMMVSLNTLQSDTRWTTVPSGATKRTFATPSLNLNLTVRDLPHGLRLRTRLRTDYRYSSHRSIDPAWSVRAYEMLLERDFSDFSVQAGRFSNRYASYGGYWDGALVQYGARRAGVGTALGFMPDRSNEGFSTDMPRYAGFAHVEFGNRARWQYAVRLSLDEIRPVDPLLTHRFGGLSHSLRWRGVSLRNDVQLDRDPETGRWIASRFQVRGSISPARGVTLHGRYTVRQPYSIYRVQRVISYRRDQAHAGASFQFGGGLVGADVAFNYVEDAVEGRRADGRTVSGYFQLSRTRLLALSLAATASYWQADDGSSFFLNTGVSRSLGRANARLQYQFYRTVTVADPLLTHAVVAHAAVPLGRRFSGSSQVRLQRSATLRSVAFYLSLSYTF